MSDERQLTCFVVIGFGVKPDFASGRVLDLDKTYELLIRPAMDRCDINAFRAIDANLTGSIDTLMYRWIYEADIVVADLSTLNANVFYELGVRHAQKPHTTIIIAESVLMSKIPFDLSSFVIHQYHHGGDHISEREQERFVEHLAGVQQGILDAMEAARELDPDGASQPDSPVFTFLPGMTGPLYRADTALVPPPYVPPDERAALVPAEGESLSSIIDAAEAAKKAKQFPEAIRLFQKAIDTELASKPDTDQDKKPDTYLAQRLALVTYKNGETPDDDGNVDRDEAIAALLAAERILARYCAPRLSTDPETLGLSGAINKRLSDWNDDDLTYLDRAIAFYERGFYVKQDYYNGINVAFMYTQRANLLDDRFEAIVSYGHANMIRRKVAEVCDDIIADEDFETRGDRAWVYMTLAECYQGLGREDDEARLRPQIEAVADDFALSTYSEQKEKLGAAMAEFRDRHRPDDLDADAAPRPAGAGAVTPQLTGGVPVSIDPSLTERPVRSIEVSYKIEYD